MKQFNNLAIILFGPPGSGKGTQAQLLADKLNLFHFDTGKYIRDILYPDVKSGSRPKRRDNLEFKNNATIKREKNLNESGQLNTSSWVFKIVSKKIKEIDKINKGIVLSGSPRTFLEAFGDGQFKGIIKILESDYGKKNIFIFVFNISESESIERNTHRLVCSMCRMPVLNISKHRNIKMSKCPFCGGKMNYRFDDKKDIIKRRWAEYKKQTYSIIKELKRKKYRVISIDATPLPYRIHQKILSTLKNYGSFS